MTTCDLIFRDATVIDGTGGARRVLDVSVTAGRIDEVGKVTRSGHQEVDAEGLLLCPGFIDVHSHDDFWALLHPELSEKALQGVTTEILGNCGIGAAPRPGADDWIERFGLLGSLPEYTDYADYFAALGRARPALNLAVLAGHGALRNTSAPGVQRPLTAPELGRLGDELERALNAGAIGLSSGLIYEPGCHATEGEMNALVSRLKGRSALYATHLRNEADHLLPAVTEAIATAEAAGVGLQLSHHKAHGRNNWGRVSDSLGLVDQAILRGVDVWLDQYPYTAGSTILEAVLKGGRLSGAAHMGLLLPKDVVISAAADHRELEGKSIQDLMDDWAVGAEDAAARVLACSPSAWVVVHAMSEEDVRTVMKHPRVLFGSDGLPTETGNPHPRLYSTFPRILSHYVRDEGVIGLEEAVSKMTGLAARRFGLAERGEIRQGFHADLVLLSLDGLSDAATFQAPRQSPAGVRGVWVNGQAIALSDSDAPAQLTGARSGQLLRAI